MMSRIFEVNKLFLMLVSFLRMTSSLSNDFARVEVEISCISLMATV